MAVTVTHATTATGTDAGTGEIHKAQWNAGHTVANASEVGHDHDGSPESKLAQANTHESPDTDSGTSSLHHTIGSGANQAAAGNHTHAGTFGSGTSFPGSPSTDDLFYRTDRDLLYFYDGTRWLTTTLYVQTLGIWTNVSAGGAPQGYTPVWSDLYDVFMVDLIATMHAASGITGSAYWTLTLYTWDGGTQGSAITSVSNQSGTNATFERKIASINALMGTAKDALDLTLGKVSTVGNFNGGGMLTYRLVG